MSPTDEGLQDLERKNGFHVEVTIDVILLSVVRSVVHPTSDILRHLNADEEAGGRLPPWTKEELDNAARAVAKLGEDAGWV
jgi:hypothetical protein